MSANDYFSALCVCQFQTNYSFVYSKKPPFLNLDSKELGSRQLSLNEPIAFLGMGIQTTDSEYEKAIKFFGPDTQAINPAYTKDHFIQKSLPETQEGHSFNEWDNTNHVGQTTTTDDTQSKVKDSLATNVVINSYYAETNNQFSFTNNNDGIRNSQTLRKIDILGLNSYEAGGKQHHIQTTENPFGIKDTDELVPLSHKIMIRKRYWELTYIRDYSFEQKRVAVLKNHTHTKLFCVTEDLTPTNVIPEAGHLQEKEKHGLIATCRKNNRLQAITKARNNIISLYSSQKSCIKPTYLMSCHSVSSNRNTITWNLKEHWCPGNLFNEIPHYENNGNNIEITCKCGQLLVAENCLNSKNLRP